MFNIFICCLLAVNPAHYQASIANDADAGLQLPAGRQVSGNDSTIYLNINFMNRGYCYAYSTQPKSEDPSFNGWADSDNIPVRITDPGVSKGALQVMADTRNHIPYAGKFKGFKLSVYNTSGDTAAFRAQDSRLDLRLQAMNKKGEWADIEYLPGSTCGNSYHTLKLEPGAQWNFVVPDYQGSFKTRIRARLAVINKTDPAKELILYSNEFKGSVNPGQFTDKKQYQSSGLMDPYEN